MFGIGFSEVLVIAVILIIVVGPARLPGLMAALGKTLRSARQASEELRSSLGLRDLMRQDPFAPYPGSRPPKTAENAGGGAKAGREAEMEEAKAPVTGQAGDGSGAEPDKGAGEDASAGTGAAAERAGETAGETPAPGEDPQRKERR
jgi:sec-independent protein translocase protein TatB